MKGTELSEADLLIGKLTTLIEERDASLTWLHIDDAMLEHLILLALILFVELWCLLLHGDHEAQGSTTQIIRLRHPCHWGETRQSQLTLLMSRGGVAKDVLTDTLGRIPEEETLRALLLTAQLLESQTHRLAVLRHIIYGARDDVHQILT